MFLRNNLHLLTFSHFPILNNSITKIIIIINKMKHVLTYLKFILKVSSQPVYRCCEEKGYRLNIENIGKTTTDKKVIYKTQNMSQFGSFLLHCLSNSFLCTTPKVNEKKGQTFKGRVIQKKTVAGAQQLYVEQIVKLVCLSPQQKWPLTGT